MGEKRAAPKKVFMRIPEEKRRYWDAIQKAQSYFRGRENVDEVEAHRILKTIQELALAAGFDPRLASKFLIKVEERSFSPKTPPNRLPRGDFILNCIFEESAIIQGRKPAIWATRPSGRGDFIEKIQNVVVDVDKKELLPLCTPSEREYYQTLFGFDPVMDRSILPDDYGAIPPGAQIPFYDIDESYEDGIYTTPYRYEAEFPLVNDLPFAALGVIMVARVDYDCMRVVRNVIVFKRGADESYVDCMHTVAYNVPAAMIEENEGDFAELKESMVDFESSGDFRQISGKGVILPPWGHFAALKSFVGGIAEFGVKQLINYAIAPKESEEGDKTCSPFGINEQLLHQFLRALEEKAPSATSAIRRDFLINLLETSTVDWLVAHSSPPLPAGSEKIDDSEQNLIMPWQDSRALLEDLYKNAPPDWILTHQEKITAYFGHLIPLSKSTKSHPPKESNDRVHHVN